MDDAAVLREARITDLATQFVFYMRDHSGASMYLPDEVDAETLPSAVARLDEELGQMADFASVYAGSSQADLEPFALPSAALVGAYLHQAAGASWVEPLDEADSTVLIAMPNGLAVDLTGYARATLLSGAPSFSALLEKLLTEPDDGEA